MHFLFKPILSIIVLIAAAITSTRRGTMLIVELYHFPRAKIHSPWNKCQQLDELSAEIQDTEFENRSITTD